MTSSAANLHGTAVVLDEAGVLILGDSGTGKTMLALHLIEAWRDTGRFSRLVSDDQVLPEAIGGKLVVSSPATIGGLVEIWGKGPVRTQTLPSAIIDLVVRLKPAALRFQDMDSVEILGCRVPAVVVAPRNAPSARRVVEAVLSHLHCLPKSDYTPQS